jgi:molybdopterin converting factor small subunit
MGRRMEIRVRLSGNLRQYFEEEKQFQLDKEATVGDLVDGLGFAEGEVGVVALNGGLAARSEELHEGDEVLLFPPIGGG